MIAVLLGLALAGEPMHATDLSWLAGTWVQEKDGTRTEETWLPPEADALFGIHRATAAGATRFYEYLRIEEQDDTLVYVVWPKGAPAPTDFRATRVTETEAVFENPDHDFPKRLHYVRRGDRLEVAVRGEGDKGFDLVFERR